MADPSLRQELESAFGLYGKAQEMYPRLPKNVAYKENFGGAGDGRQMEFYPQGERDSFDPSKPAVEVFNPQLRPQDIAADITSHHMIDSDPQVGGAYRQFLMSMQPWQQKKLQEQYGHAQKNHGEQRPFSQWAETTGEPAWLRGQAFGQWPEQMYTPEQRTKLDAMVRYLKGEAP